MKKILFRAFILCTLIPSMWLSAANAVSDDAECLSLENDSGAIFSVCLEGDVSKAKLTNKTKSEILGLAHQLKKGAVSEPLAKKNNYGYGGMYSNYYPTITTPAVVTTPAYINYSPTTTTPVVPTPAYTDYSDYYATTTPAVVPTPAYTDYSDYYATTTPAVVPTTPAYTDYSDYYPVTTTPTVTETPDYTDYYPDNSVTPEVNEPDPYDMCAMYPSYPGCSS